MAVEQYLSRERSNNKGRNIDRNFAFDQRNNIIVRKIVGGLD